MAKVITFSRIFPTYHPRKGDPTFFVEKFLNSVGVCFTGAKYMQDLLVLNSKNIARGKLNYTDIENFYLSLNAGMFDTKCHTIRDGERFEMFDFFSPRVWKSKPYTDCQIIFAKDTLVHSTVNFKIEDGAIFMNDELYAYGNSTELLDVLANNDGLSQIDLLNWFKYPNNFKGQIIIFDEVVIKY